MSLLELEHVSKRFRHGARRVEALRDVSLQLHERELVAVWGPTGSGRSTLLRLAAGIELPDGGSVRFRGRELAVGGGAIARGIAYCHPISRSLDGHAVLDELIAAQLALGVRPSQARDRAWESLERVDARECERQRPYELERSEAVRVSIARALLQRPSLLLIDEPTKGVDPRGRDSILEMLRSLREENVATLLTLDQGIGLFAADRALSLSCGELHGHVSPGLAPVVELPRRANG